MTPTPEPAARRRMAAATAGLLLAGAVLGPGAAAQEETVETRFVDVAARPEETTGGPVIVDRLAPATVLTIRAFGFTADTTGIAHQCVVGEAKRCENQIPVRFDDDGTATFQYLVTDSIGSSVHDGEPCRLEARSLCTIEIRSRDTVAVVETVFVDAAPAPGIVQVTPDDELLVGQEVTVAARGFPADTKLHLTVCAVPSRRGGRCGAPGPELTIVTDDRGEAAAQVVLDVTKVGADGVACARRTTCQIVLASDSIGVRAQPVRLGFRTAPPPDYDGARVAVGLVAALLLGASAIRLIRRTDWSPPPEADGSAIDDAEYADLDREALLFEEQGAGRSR